MSYGPKPVSAPAPTKKVAASPVAKKRGRGRPKGSKNRPKAEIEAEKRRKANKKAKGTAPKAKKAKTTKTTKKAGAKDGAPPKKKAKAKAPKKINLKDAEVEFQKQVEDGPPELKNLSKKKRTTSRRNVEGEASKRQDQAIRLLIKEFTDSQSDRFAAYKRGKLPNATVKRVMQEVTPKSVPKTAQIAVQAAAKLYVGELVEESKSVMSERGDTGPVRPWHIEEAYKRLQNEGRAPTLFLAPNMGAFSRGFK